MSRKILWIIFLLVLLFAAKGSAGHIEAIDTSQKISNAINSLTLPYEREFTPTQLNQLGVDHRNRPFGNYKIRIKEASYNSTSGVLILNMYAWHNNTSLATHSPWKWYIPFPIAGTNNNQRLNSFLVLLGSNIDNLPYGSPVGDDAATLYPIVDGYAGEATDQSYTNIRGDTGDQSDSSGTTSYLGYLRCANTPNTDIYIDMYRGIFSFNTSSIGASGATVDSALLKTTTVTRTTQIGTPNVAITGGTLASNTSIANGDYDGFTATPLTNFISISSLPGTNGDIYNWTFNSDGKTYIQNRLDGTEHTVLYLRDSWDINASFGGSWGALYLNYWRYYTNESTTDAYDPFLYITYTPGGCSSPVAAFSGNVTSGYPSFPILFTDASTNTPTDWDWYFGDETKDSDSQNPTWTLNNVIGNTPTSYTVKLYSANACGGDWENKTDYITAYPLLSNFSMNVSSGCAPLTVGFTDTTSNGTATTWSWDFGGDGSSASQNPSHTFNSPGTYYVQLNASNSYSWDIENKTASITVSPGAPTASFTQNVTWGYPEFPVLFNDTSTGSPSAWDWYFPNGGDAHTQNATWTFDYVIGDTATAYNVSLNASNTCGYSWSNQTFLIWEYPLLTNFSADVYEGCAPLTVTFTDSTTNGTPSAWNWSFGTGDYNATQNPEYTYTTPGIYDVILNASNLYSFGIETKIALINVTNCAGVPIAAFSANVTSGCPVLNVLFTDASTGNITNWSWDVNNDGTPDAFAQNYTAAYGVPGTYSVNLTVTGPGGSDSEVKISYITVNDNVISADFSADDTTPVVGQLVTFTDMSTGGPDAWNWSFGDGDFSNLQNPTHVYALAGTYSVNLSATNICGGDDAENKTDYIVVANVTPTPTSYPGTGNVTYIYGEDQDYVPLPIWLSLVVAMIAMFGHSLIFTRNTDLTASLTAVMAFVAAWTANMIGYYDMGITVNGTEVYVNPTIKTLHPPWLVYIMLIFAFISIINLYYVVWKIHLKNRSWRKYIED